MLSRFPLGLKSSREARSKRANQLAFARAAAASAKEFILRPKDERGVQFAANVDRMTSLVGRGQDPGQLQFEFVEEVKAFAEFQRNEVDEVITGMTDSMEEMIGGISVSIIASNQRVEELNQIRTMIDKAETCLTLEETRSFLSSGMVALQKLVEQEIQTQRDLWRSHDSYSTLLRSKLEHLEKQNRIDPLTGVANRAGIERHIKMVLDHCRTNKKSYSFALLDLDGFKAVNDRFGHQAGDAALIAFGQRLMAALGNQAFVGRLGGDEFVVVSPTETEMLSLLLHRLNENLVDQPIVHGNRALNIGASFGIQPILPIATFEDLHKLADAAMYTAKRTRRAA